MQGNLHSWYTWVLSESNFADALSRFDASKALKLGGVHTPCTYPDLTLEKWGVPASAGALRPT
eukprot:1306890-Amphidinium_carterae.1